MLSTGQLLESQATDQTTFGGGEKDGRGAAALALLATAGFPAFPPGPTEEFWSSDNKITHFRQEKNFAKDTPVGETTGF